MPSFFTFKSYWSALILVFLVLGGSLASKASHLAAADLYIDYIGSGANDYSYRVTLAVYKACEPGAIPLEDEETVTYSSPSGCGLSGTLDMKTPKIDTLDQLCPDFKASNSCRDVNSIFPAFIRHIWVKDVTLSGP